MTDTKGGNRSFAGKNSHVKSAKAVVQGPVVTLNDKLKNDLGGGGGNISKRI